MKNSLNDFIIDYSLSDKLSNEMMRKYEILPLEEHEIFITVASSIKYESHEISEIFNKPIKFLELDSKVLEFEFYHLEAKKELYKLAKKSIIDFDEKSKEHSNIRLFCEKLFLLAISLDSSDIHIETSQDGVVIRFRIDGILVQFLKIDLELYPIISSIIKVFASLDITLKRLPQDGRFSKRLDGCEYDFRVSTLPTISGESIVLRVLDNKKAYLTLDSLGFDMDTYEKLRKNIYQTNGMILITGATGSGKTTTIYSILNELNDNSKKIISLEDPIEYHIDGVVQVNINDEIGLDYHTVLRNILRQDPDILIIGEIRDAISLKIAVQAALTGHLVFATLHTNGAIDSIDRLLNLGAEPFLIASVLRFILSQRLVRILCDDCKEPYLKDSVKLYKAVGCKSCSMSGYKGRTIISESLEIDQPLSQIISQEKNINKESLLDINHTFTKRIYAKVLQGSTSLEEYLLMK